MLLLLLSSLASICTLTGLVAGLVVFAFLIVIVEHYMGGGAWGWPDRGRRAYVPVSAYVAISRRDLWRVAVFAVSTGAVLFAVGLGLLVA